MRRWRAAGVVEREQAEARGVELSRDLVQAAIARGVTVYQGDLEASLADYPDQAFDFVILSQTVQETRHPLVVLKEMLRIGRHAIVAFPNFGHWRVGLNHLLSGRAPKTGLFPFEWYDSPNIHFLTVIDFEETGSQAGLAGGPPALSFGSERGDGAAELACRDRHLSLPRPGLTACFRSARPRRAPAAWPPSQGRLPYPR